MFALLACAAPAPELTRAPDQLLAARGAEPRLCVAPNGTAYALWTDEGHLWLAASFLRGEPGTWSAPARVNQGEPGTGVFSYDVYCDDLGAFAVWEEDRNTVGAFHQLFFNRTVDLGATFLPDDLQIDVGAGTGMSVAPRIVGDGQAMYAVWADDGLGEYHVWMAAGSAGGERWERALELDHGAGPATAPAVAASGGDLAVAWEDARSGTPEVWFAHGDIAVFSIPARISAPGAASAPVLCADGAAIHAVWAGSPGVGAASSADAGDTWGPAAQLDAASGAPVCAAEGGLVHVLSTDGGDIRYQALAEGALADRADLTGTGGAPQIAVGAGGLVAAWTEGGTRLVYAWSAAGRALGDGALRLDDGGDSQKAALQLAVSGDHALALWLDDRAGPWGVAFATAPVGE